ncbi:MAG: GH3 auxin-responsive promoter family protein [Rhizobiaceae bacterium]
MKATLLRPAAWWTAREVKRAGETAVESQARTLRSLLARGKDTAFGRAHGFSDIRDGREFQRRVPLSDYDAYSPWIDRIKAGEADVTWPGRPAYFAMTSGTTAGTKFVPLTREMMPNQYGSTRRALLNHYGRTGRGGWADGTAVVLVGSPELKEHNGVPTGLLSGIINHHVPRWFRSMSLPGERVIRIPNWEEKMAALVEESRDRDVRLLGGSPLWMLMYFEYLLAATGRSAVLDVFPNLSTFVHGGVDYGTHRQAIEHKLGGRIDTVEIYPATEAFVAFQYAGPGEGMLLNVGSGVYFEFVPLDKAGDPHAERLSVGEVETGVDYVIAVSTHSGFWGYAMGDTVRFVSTKPPLIVITGRTKNFISMANERLMAKEVEDALAAGAAATGVRTVEFTVAPQPVPPAGGRAYHEWYVEFDGEVPDAGTFMTAVEAYINGRNYNYNAFRKNGVIAPPRLMVVRPGGFREYMKAVGRMGGQYKLPHLQNNRAIADALRPFIG